MLVVLQGIVDTSTLAGQENHRSAAYANSSLETDETKSNETTDKGVSSLKVSTSSTNSLEVEVLPANLLPMRLRNKLPN